MYPIRKAGALIFSGKNLLIAKPKGKSYFITPGGKYESGESAEGCLRRELREELHAGLVSYKHYKTYNTKTNDGRPLILELYIVKINRAPKPSSEIGELEWMAGEDFSKNKFELSHAFYEFVPDLIKDGFL